MAASKKHGSLHAIPTEELENADEVELKSLAHSLLESKFEKMMSSAGNPEQLSKTKKLAVEWLKKWDLDQDGALSSMELKAAAMDHVKLKQDYKTRGLWMIILAVLVVCCGGVILGVSIWANAISKDSEVETGDDLGGYSMRKKDGTAVVKTATALYEFRLPRIGYLPFDELSTIESISFLYMRSMRQMSVAGFRWYGTRNITFFSPRGERLTITKASEETVTMTYQERGATTPTIIYDGTDPDLLLQQLAMAAIASVAQQGQPLSVAAVWKALGPSAVLSAQLLPPDCVGPALDFALNDNLTALQGPCAFISVAVFQGLGVVEAKIGPQDYYGTEMSAEERSELTGYAKTVSGNLFIADPVERRARYREWIARQISVYIPPV